MITLTVRTTRAKLIRAIASLPKAIGRTKAGKKMMHAVGAEVLDLVSTAFIKKSAGGTDEAGDRWKPLSPYTVAYRRKRPGVLWPPKRRAKLAPSAALNKKQRSRWWAVYYKILASTNDKSTAARGAWRVLRAEGATTLMDLYGTAHAMILVESGQLLNSLLPPTGGPRAQQVFRVRGNSVEVGTRRKWAGTHHKGSGHIPQRRLWPPPSKWPNSWWKRINGVVTIGLGGVLREILKG